MDNLWYLALAYAVIWIGLFAYLANLAREERSIRQRMDLLQDLVDGSTMESEAGSTPAEAWDERPERMTIAARPAGRSPVPEG